MKVMASPGEIPDDMWITCDDTPAGVVARVFSEQSNGEHLWQSQAIPYTAEADVARAMEVATGAAVRWARDYAGWEPLGPKATPPAPIAGELEANRRRPWAPPKLVAPHRPPRSGHGFDRLASMQATIDLLVVRVHNLERAVMFGEAERKRIAGQQVERNPNPPPACPLCGWATIPGNETRGERPWMGDDGACRICGEQQ